MERQMDKDKTRVIILTRHYRIIGEISILPEARVTDYICESRDFIAVTDADVWDQDQRKVASTTFLNINRGDVELLIPEDCVTQGGGMNIPRKI